MDASMICTPQKAQQGKEPADPVSYLLLPYSYIAGSCEYLKATFVGQTLYYVPTLPQESLLATCSSKTFFQKAKGPGHIMH